MVLVAVVRHAWAPAENAEHNMYLTLTPGDTIAVVQRGDHAGWWGGKLNKQLGWFPSSFCDIVEQAGGVASGPQPPADSPP